MFSNPERFTSASKALFESQIAAFHALSDKTIESVERTIALNLGATKASMENCIAVAKQLSAAKDAQELISLGAAQAKPAAKMAASYSRDLSDIASGVRDEFTKVAEAQFTDARSKISTLIDSVTKAAPAGSEPAVAMLKSAIDNASAGYEQLSKATRQAVETVEAQAVKASAQFSPVTEDATLKAAKK